MLITPHVSAVSFPKDVAEIFATNLERYLESGTTHPQSQHLNVHFLANFRAKLPQIWLLSLALLTGKYRNCFANICKYLQMAQVEGKRRVRAWRCVLNGRILIFYRRILISY